MKTITTKQCNIIYNKIFNYNIILINNIKIAMFHNMA